MAGCCPAARHWPRRLRRGRRPGSPGLQRGHRARAMRRCKHCELRRLPVHPHGRRGPIGGGPWLCQCDEGQFDGRGTSQRAGAHERPAQPVGQFTLRPSLHPDPGDPVPCRSRRDLRPDLLSLAPLRAVAFRLLDRTAGARHRRLGQLLPAAGDRTNLGAPAECGGLRDHALRSHEHRRTQSDAWLSPERIHDEMRPGVMGSSFPDWDAPIRARPGTRQRLETAGPGDTWQQQYDESVTDAAVAYLSDAARRDGPWAAVVGWFLPHTPLTVRPEYFDQYFPAHADQPSAPSRPLDTVHPQSRRLRTVPWRGRLIG